MALVSADAEISSGPWRCNMSMVPASADVAKPDWRSIRVWCPPTPERERRHVHSLRDGSGPSRSLINPVEDGVEDSVGQVSGDAGVVFAHDPRQAPVAFGTVE